VGQRIVIEPVTRVEGHGKITIQLDENGNVVDACFHVTQLRGFEKFCEGRPYSEMPSLVERICGICPISHSIASAKACDEILGVRIPETGDKLRRLVNCGEFIQSHALSFFYLSAPDLALGFDAPPEKRNLIGLLEANPSMASDGIRLRSIGQQVIEACAGKRIHPSWVVPGGVNEPLRKEQRERLLCLIPDGYRIVHRTLAWLKEQFHRFNEEIRTFANFPSLFMGLVNKEGNLEHVNGALRIVDAKGRFVADGVDGASYRSLIGERSESYSYLKSPYYLPLGYPDGMYRVGPAARLNVCNGCGTTMADQEWAEFIRLDRGPVMSSFHNHLARLIEILYSLETMEKLLGEDDILDTRVRSYAKPNFSEGVGIVEAPRGVLIHHYRVDEQGLMQWANMIVATGNNNLAMNKGVLQVAKRFVQGDRIPEAALNRIEGVIRAFDPCLSCSTHAIGGAGLRIELVNSAGEVLDERIYQRGCRTRRVSENV